MNDGHHELTQWFEAHNRPLALYARQYLDDHAAADVVQEAFVKLLTVTPRPGDIRPWLFRVVRNAALNEIRRRSTRDRHAELIAANKPKWFGDSMGEQLDAQDAQLALGQLMTEQSELIVMRIWGQMTYQQMAGVTGAAVSTVYGRYCEALELLRKKMEKS